MENIRSTGVSVNSDKTIPSNNSDIFLTNKTEIKAKIVVICMFLDDSQQQYARSLMYSISKIYYLITLNYTYSKAVTCTTLQLTAN